MKTINKKEQNYTNMKNAVIDQVILWIVLFTIFVTILFFIIEYSNAIKVKDNTDAIADYAARMVALDRTDAEIIDGINENIKDDFFSDVTGITCTEDTTASTYQVILNVKTTLSNDFLTSNEIHSRTVVFNESSEFKKECDITIAVK